MAATPYTESTSTIRQTSGLCTEEPVYPAGEILEELRKDLEHYLLALEQPVLEYAELVPNREPPGFDVEQPF